MDIMLSYYALFIMLLCYLKALIVLKKQFTALLYFAENQLETVMQTQDAVKGWNNF